MEIVKEKSNPLIDLKNKLGADRVEVWYEKAIIKGISRKGDFIESYSNTGKVFAVLWKGNKRFVGISKCNPVDSFTKEVGRDIALKRALFIYNNVDHSEILFKRYHAEYKRSFGDVKMFFFDCHNEAEFTGINSHLESHSQMKAVKKYVSAMPEWLYKKMKDNGTI